MTSVTWPQLITRAGTSEEVIATARNYIANLDREILARVPEALQPGKIVDTHDVASYGYELARYHYNNNDPEVVEVIKNLSAFFSQAVARLAQLAAPQPATREVVKFFST